MGIPIKNCELKIERRVGTSQKYRLLIRSSYQSRSYINGLKDGPMVSAPWTPDDGETGFEENQATYIIITDIKESSGNSYNPVVGDRITVTNSGNMNGVYRQVAEATKHGLKEANVFYSRIPCIKRKILEDNE